jgi:hypothetical protein
MDLVRCQGVIRGRKMSAAGKTFEILEMVGDIVFLKDMETKKLYSGSCRPQDL